MKPVLLDTGVIVSVLDRSQPLHKECAALVSEMAEPLVTCEAVITESCHLLRNLHGAKEKVLENVALGLFQIPFHLGPSARELQRLLRKYGDVGMDLANACLVHLATELNTGDILTLDSDFKIYRWGANKPFRNLVALG